MDGHRNKFRKYNSIQGFSAVVFEAVFQTSYSSFVEKPMYTVIVDFLEKETLDTNRFLYYKLKTLKHT